MAGAPMPGALAQQFMDPRHKQAGRVLGYALVCGRIDTWARVSVLWERGLEEHERASIAWASLRTVNPAVAPEILTAARMRFGTTAPLPVWMDEDEDAKWWADFQAPSTLIAYATACCRALPDVDRKRFLREMAE